MSRLIRTLSMVFFCLFVGTPSIHAQDWFGGDQTQVFTNFGNPLGYKYGTGNSKYLFSLHGHRTRTYLFIFYKGECIGRVEIRSRFSSDELTSELSRYQDSSSWKLVQEFSEKGGIPDQEGKGVPNSRVEVKGWQRADRRFYAMWILMDNTVDPEVQFLALGQKKAATALTKFMEDIVVLLVEVASRNSQVAP